MSETIEGLMRRARLPVTALRKLADADAFRSMGLDRREALWAVRRLPDDEVLPLFAAADASETVFSEVLTRYYDGAPDPLTLAILAVE